MRTFICHKQTLTFLTLLIFCSSCKGQNKPDLSKENVESETKDIVASPVYNEQYIDTKYEYTDSIGKRLIIQNSLRKGGLKYTDLMGKEYVYAIYWTRIINETIDPFELRMDIPADSYELASSPGNYFKIFLPSETMTPDKEPLHNYGLAGLKFLLDYGLHKASSIKRTINPKESSAFYVVILFDRGLESDLRTGLSIKEQNLFYRINDKEIHCGKINLKKLILFRDGGKMFYQK